MAVRTIDAILANINTLIEDGLSYSGNSFYRLAVLEPLDGRTFPLRRISPDEGKKISPLDSSGMQFYHRVLSQKRVEIGGKGASVYYEVTYQMRFVGVGHRKNVTSLSTWDNEDLAREVMDIMGGSPSLTNRELMLPEGQTVTDKLTVLNTEYAGNTEMRARVLDLVAFAIDYTLKVKSLGPCAVTPDYTPISSFTYSDASVGNALEFNPTVVGDVTRFAVADSDAVNFAASGAILNLSTGAITGTLVATLLSDIIAFGSDGVTFGAERASKVFGSGTPMVSLTYADDNQIINELTAFTTMVATLDPVAATGVFTIETVAGISINSSTGDITITKSLLAKDTIHTPLVTFTANGGYSGVVTYKISILMFTTTESIKLGDETTDLTAAQLIYHWRVPFDVNFEKFIFSCDPDELPTGGLTTFDVKLNGTTIYSTKATIDAGESSTETAVTAQVLSTSSASEGDNLEVVCDGIGSSTAGKAWECTAKWTAQ